MNDESQDGLAGLFSQAEQHIGTDAYQAGVDMTRAQTGLTKQMVSMMAAKATVLHAITLILLLAAMPCIVWLWRWAL